MMLLRHLVIGSALAYQTATALPQGHSDASEGGAEIESIIVDLVTSITRGPPLPVITPINILDTPEPGLERRIKVLTVHTEKSEAGLQLPTLPPNPFTVQTIAPTTSPTTQGYQAVYISATEDSKSSQADALPQTVHSEESQASLLIPTSSQYVDIPVQAQATATKIFQISTYRPVYVPHIETTKAQLLAATVAVDSSTTSLFTSAGSVYSTVVPAQLPSTSGPSLLVVSQPGAIGVAPGSAAVIGGTTYSLAADASVLYINGVSSSLSGFNAPSTAAVTLTTSPATTAPFKAIATDARSGSTTASPAATTTKQTGAGVPLSPLIGPAIITMLVLIVLM